MCKLPSIVQFFPRRFTLNRHLLQTILVGGLFALSITGIAVSDALAAGAYFEILAPMVFGLAAGLCIGARSGAANFARLALAEQAHAEHSGKWKLTRKH